MYNTYNKIIQRGLMVYSKIRNKDEIFFFNQNTDSQNITFKTWLKQAIFQ